MVNRAQPDVPRWRARLHKPASVVAIAGIVCPVLYFVAGWDSRTAEEYLLPIMVFGMAAFSLSLIAFGLGILSRPWNEFAVIAGAATFIVLSVVSPPPGLRPREGNANESAAVANLRTINTAQITYLTQFGRFGSLDGLIAAELLGPQYTAELGVSGYRFAITLGESTYTATAEPISSNSGRYNYLTWPEDAVIRYGTKAPTAKLVGKPLY